jgi:uncharacterized protein involved in exopolysaccharide biosynthesis/Mrp family chromosome partitioning ATPase
MNNSRQVPPAQGIALGDIYYTLFRHKWKIVLMSLMGLLAAAAIYHKKAPLYESQAELLIKYVPDTTQLTLGTDNQRVIVPDSDGEDVINSEIRILTSLDVAEEAASNIGPANILAKVGGPSSVNRAAGFIYANLDAEPADSRSSVIVITLKHPDPRIVQPLLQAVIDAYLQKHYEIHSAGGQFDDALTMEQSELSVRLNATEQQLADLKNKYNIISLEDSQKNLAAQLSKVNGEIQDATAELSADEAASKQSGARQSSDLGTTNRLPAAIPQSQIDAYADACAGLDIFRKKEQDYQLQGFTRSNSLLQGIDEQIAAKLNEKDALEKKYPQIAGVAPVVASNSSTTAVPSMDPRVQLTEIVALKAKIRAWEAQLADLQTQATNLNNLAPTITQLQQNESVLQANYQTLSVKLENSRIDKELDTGKTPNIRPVQDPSPPIRDWKKTFKMMGMAVFGGVFGGIAWAFLIEMVLDRSVKRPIEVERRLKLPLFISIPNVERNGYARLARTAERRQLTFNGGSPVGEEKGIRSPAIANGNSQILSLEQHPSLQPFHKALRDRLILYFEVKNFTHKPKLVAVTGAGKGTGVSTVASGLAASLSEIGDGNVLLVDMNLENGAAQQFYKGKACCGLDTVLASETKKDALVQENLYVVNGNADSGGFSQSLPKRFTALVPKLKASEYDYIIFDMPVVSPSSITSHMARFMDITLLVVESEKTGREVVEQANAWLTEVGASVGVVLNKTHQYVPKQLHQEYLSGK